MKYVLLFCACFSLSAVEFYPEKKVTAPVKYAFDATINEGLAALIEHSMSKWTFYTEGVVRFEPALDSEPTLTFTVGHSDDFWKEADPKWVAVCSFNPVKKSNKIMFFQNRMDFLMLKEFPGRMPRYIDHEIGHALGFGHFDDDNEQIESIMNHVPAFDFLLSDLLAIRKAYPPPPSSPPDMSAIIRLNGQGLSFQFKVNGKKAKEKYSLILFCVDDVNSRIELMSVKNNARIRLYGTTGYSFYAILMDDQYCEIKSDTVGRFFRIDGDPYKKPAKKSVVLNCW